MVGDFVKEGRDREARVADPKALCFGVDEIRFVADFNHRGEGREVILGGFPVPADVDQAVHHDLLSRDQVDHSALGMSDQRDMAHPADGHCVGYLELAVAEVGSAGAQNEREIVWDAEAFSAVHAHADQEFRLLDFPKRGGEVVKPQQISDRGRRVAGGDVGFFVDGFEPVHRAPILRI